MTHDDILIRLSAWAAVFDQVEAQMDALRSVVGMEPEAPLANAVYGMWGAYTKALGEAIGDAWACLDWYCWECAMGQEPKEVRLASGESIMVSSLEDLARVIALG